MAPWDTEAASVEAALKTGETDTVAAVQAVEGDMVVWCGGDMTPH